MVKKNEISEWDAESVGETISTMEDKIIVLRHTYAMTAHKSQGSTFGAAIVDFKDINRMGQEFEFNRALYTAITRASKYTVVVV